MSLPHLKHISGCREILQQRLDHHDDKHNFIFYLEHFSILTFEYSCICDTWQLSTVFTMTNELLILPNLGIFVERLDVDTDSTAQTVILWIIKRMTWNVDFGDI